MEIKYNKDDIEKIVNLLNVIETSGISNCRLIVQISQLLSSGKPIEENKE
jgi:hypothetical protein